MRAVPWGTGLDTGYSGRREFKGRGGSGDKLDVVAGGCFDLVTSHALGAVSASGGKADIPNAHSNVCF